MFGKINSNLNNLAHETKKASQREVFALNQNTKAMNEVKETIAALPIEMADNMPKYSEREVRELKQQIAFLKEQNTFTQILKEIPMGIHLIPSFVMPWEYEIILTFPPSNDELKIKNVNFSDEHIRVQFDFTDRTPDGLTQAMRF